MREIKFRAWDGCKYIYSFTSKGVDRLGWFFSNARGLPKEQYTGLKDKSGVEIYEGDVVRCHGKWFEETYTGEVAFGLNDMYWPTGAHESADAVGWYLKGAGIPLLPSTDEPFHEISYEVIGSVWENPELLED
jgi:uncharacterized phage protein (TIGR01671 family)